MSCHKAALCERPLKSGNDRISDVNELFVVFISIGLHANDYPLHTARLNKKLNQISPGKYSSNKNIGEHSAVKR